MNEVVCLETGERFPSQAAAARAAGVSASAIRNALDGTAGGYYWIYAHERGGPIASVSS